MQWEDFAGLSREEKREAEEASRDLVLRASRPPRGRVAPTAVLARDATDGHVELVDVRRRG
eukprot:3995071-Heterocapsa_arctica.AAC.1